MASHSFARPTLCVAMLASDDEELVRHQVAHIKYYLPTAKIVFYDNRLQKRDAFERDVHLYPYSTHLPDAEKGNYLFSLMHWLVETNERYDYFIALDPNTMLIKPGFERWLDQQMQGTDMMGIHLCRYENPEQSEHWLPGRKVWEEWSLWQPLLQAEGFFGASGSLQVFRHELVQKMVEGVSVAELKRIWQKSSGTYMEEIVYPTLAHRFGGQLRAFPSESVSFVRYERSWSREEVQLAKGNSGCFFMYPFKADAMDGARQFVYRTLPRSLDTLFDVPIRVPVNSAMNETWRKICEQAPPDYTIPDPAIVKRIVPSDLMEPPIDSCHTIEQWVKSQQGSKREGDIFYREYFPEERFVFRKSPRSLAKQQNQIPVFAFVQEYTPSNGAVAVIPGGRVWGENGAVITPDHKLLYGVSREWVESPNEHPIFLQKKLPYVREIDGTVAALACSSGTNYYHWMHEVLPRLLLLKRSGIPVDYYVVNHLERSFQTETLRLLGISEEKVIESHEDLHLKPTKLAVTSMPHRAKWAGDLIRDAFLHRRTLESARSRKAGTRLYISRSKSPIRNVLNEAEVAAVLQSYGFQIVRLEEHSVEQQIRLFASAEAIVSPHGAGLSNLVFCQPGTKVIELFAPDFVRDGFWRISNYYELDYSVLLAKKGERPAQLLNSSWYYKGSDNMEVDVQSLLEILAKTGIDR